MRSRSARRLLRTIACGVSISRPAISFASTAMSELDGTAERLAKRVSQQRLVLGGVQRPRRLTRSVAPSRPISARVSRGQRGDRRREAVDESSDPRVRRQAIHQAAQRYRRRAGWRARCWRVASVRPCAISCLRRVAQSIGVRARLDEQHVFARAASASAARKRGRAAAGDLARRRPPPCVSRPRAPARAAAASVEHLRGFRLPRGDDRRDRLEQESAQQPDENEDVDRLQAEGPPVEMHIARRLFDERIGEQDEQRDHQAIDRHGLDHREADEQRARSVPAASGWRAIASMAAATARPSASAGPIAPKQTAMAAAKMLTISIGHEGLHLGLFLRVGLPSPTAAPMKTVDRTAKI